MNSIVMMIKKLCSYLDEKHIKYKDIDHLLDLLKDVTKDEVTADILLPLYKKNKHFISGNYHMKHLLQVLLFKHNR